MIWLDFQVNQAQGPFLNPLEQNISEAKILIDKVSKSEYVLLFKKAGSEIWENDDIPGSSGINLQFGIPGIAIAAFENSDKVNQFSSRFDYFLRGEVILTDKEKKGLEVVNLSRLNVGRVTGFLSSVINEGRICNFLSGYRRFTWIFIRLNWQNWLLHRLHSRPHATCPEPHAVVRRVVPYIIYGKSCRSIKPVSILNLLNTSR